MAVMNRDTAEHFYAWLERYVPADQQYDVEQAIHRLLRNYPDMVETHTWPEMRDIAERNYAEQEA